jgi:peroxiredoxin
MSTKIQSGSAFPPFSWPSITGDSIAPAEMSGWRFLTIYRGKHCPLCKKYLTELNGMQNEFAASGIDALHLQYPFAGK